MIKNARILRRDSTLAEQKFWNHFRNKKFQNLKFRRQHRIIWANGVSGINYFITDFYCAKHKLVIEIDGSIHDEQKERDLWREEILKKQGYHIMRFKNEDLEEMDKVKIKLKEFITKLTTEII
ncbi:MAG: endonuclease domain-containing protein [Cyclobacteriaceae bacterium]|nr:endonuclease domain-containing protein [Cyclobacteriaceae bacterium]